jgi:hypothetical protein
LKRHEKGDFLQLTLGPLYTPYFEFHKSLPLSLKFLFCLTEAVVVFSESEHTTSHDLLLCVLAKAVGSFLAKFLVKWHLSGLIKQVTGRHWIDTGTRSQITNIIAHQLYNS